MRSRQWKTVRGTTPAATANSEFLETLDQGHPGLIPRPATPQTHQGLEPRIG